MNKVKPGIYRLGILILIVLAILTGVEYAVALTIDSTVILFLIAMLKGALVLYYFMHIASLWSEEGGH
jgi:heme/copper-type cytochrome/quinol oxidase subunit 4